MSSKATIKEMGNDKLAEQIRKYALVIIMILLCIVFGSASPTFRKLGNVINIFRQSSINGILAVGMTLVIIIAGIDLSIGPLCAIAGVVAALYLEVNPDGVAVAILLGVFSAALMSVWTAVLVSLLNVAPFIATLSTMSVAKGLVLVVADGVAGTHHHGLFTCKVGQELCVHVAHFADDAVHETVAEVCHVEVVHVDVGNAAANGGHCAGTCKAGVHFQRIGEIGDFLH